MYLYIFRTNARYLNARVAAAGGRGYIHTEYNWGPSVKGSLSHSLTLCLYGVCVLCVMRLKRYRLRALAFACVRVSVCVSV